MTPTAAVVKEIRNSRRSYLSAACAMKDHVKCRSSKCTCPHHGEVMVRTPPSRNGSQVPATSGIPDSSQTLLTVPAERLVSGKNPRRNLGDLDGLVASIKAMGIVEPLIVEPTGVVGQYVVVAGHRRLEAAKVAGFPAVPCVVREASDDRSRLELAIVENLQRADLEPLDEAEGYRTLVGLGLTQRKVAERVGCSQSHVSKRLALLELPAPVRKRVAAGTLPLEAAAALVRLVDHPERLKEVAGNDPSTIVRGVEQAEKLIAYGAKLAELAEVAKGKGWGVVEAPAWNAKRPWKTLAHWNGPPELDIDATAHAAEPCQGIVVPSADGFRYGRAPTATSVCLEPARHGPKGASALKVKAPAKREPTSREQLEREDAKRCKEAAAARAVVIREALSLDHPHATRGRTTPATDLIMAALVEAADVDVAKIVCELIERKPVSENGWTNWRGAIAEADESHGRVALAVALASIERWLRSPHHEWSDRDVRHIAFLEDLGYEPTAWERDQLAKAAKG